MSKLSVIGLETDKADLFDRLMDLGVTELRDQSQKLQEEDWTKITRRDGNEDEVSVLDGQIAEVGTILDMIGRYDNGKKPLFPERKVISRMDYDRLLGDGSQARKDVEELNALYEEWNACKTQENVLTSARAALMPWVDYDLPLEYGGSESVRVLCGVIPAVSDVQELKNKVTEVSDATDVAVISRDQEQQYLSVMYMKADEEAVTDVFKSFGFTQTLFKNMAGTVSDNLTRLNEQLAQAGEKEKQVEARFTDAASLKEELQYYYDSLIMARDKAKASENLLRTKESFYLECWVISRSKDQVQKLLEEKGCWYEFTEPAKDEETPVLLENNSLVTPFETVTDLYSLPSSTEIDPTPIFSIFYFIFFGMMFADMGYGIILAVVCFAALKCIKLEGLAYKLVKMLAFCGISTFIWGALFGGFFGNIITVISETFFGHAITIKPLWFDPLADPMKMLIFSCVIGGVHLLIGMGVNAYLLLRDGKVLDAIESVFVWYAFLIGVVLLLFGGSLFDGAAGIGKWLAIIGAVGIVGIPVFRGKGVGKLLGLWNLYGCTGYLGDVLSYSRLLALGLASAVIAQVFNALGGMLGHGVVAVIGFIIIAVIGHVFNFAINALGTFVHASRLQYVEFFGKFYTGGGVPFKPFKKNTKYVNIVKEEK